MPAWSRAQQRFMGAELARKRAGKKTETGMSERQLEDFARTKHSEVPERSKHKRAARGHELDPETRRHQAKKIRRRRKSQRRKRSSSEKKSYLRDLQEER